MPFGGSNISISLSNTNPLTYARCVFLIVRGFVIDQCIANEISLLSVYETNLPRLRPCGVLPRTAGRRLAELTSVASA